MAESYENTEQSGFGNVKLARVDEAGRIVLSSEAQEIFLLSPGDVLLVNTQVAGPGVTLYRPEQLQHFIKQLSTCIDNAEASECN